MNKDTLFLLNPGFEDPAFPGKKFYCWHCALLEGLLVSFPDLAKQLEVKRISWPRPRHDVVALVGEDNQSLPLLILANGDRTVHQSGECQGRAFVSEKDAILATLSQRHHFPYPHP